MLPILLFATAGKEPQALPAITIDACVDVDAEEVRRLTALELGSSQLSADVTRLEVTVACTATAQELRVTDRATRAVTVRNIELSAQLQSDRDAAARELSLAIAEVVRRTERESAPAPPQPAPALPRAEPSQPTPAEHDVPAPEPRPWRAELGVSGVLARWTGGEVLMGVDAAGRLRFGDRLLSDLRLGGRKTRPVELQSGSLDASGISASAGLSLDLVPYVTGGGVAVGVRLGADWLRYTTVAADGTPYGGADVRAFSMSATATAFFEIVRPVSITADAAVGSALHSIGIRENGRTISGMGGVLLSGALGVSAHF